MTVIIPYGSNKQNKASIAGRMYTGSYHRACLKYALSISLPENIFILSAKYGLLRLIQVIRPYNLKMGEPGCVIPAQVKSQAKELDLLNDIPIILGGRLYASICEQVWEKCINPLDGKGRLGYQIQWLNKNQGRIPE
jgi:hypothetical protein